MLTIFLLVELVTDQLPKTPSRKTPPQFVTRLLTGAFAGAVHRQRRRIHTVQSRSAPALIGAVLGTLGGAEARSRLVAANGGHDLPVALGEDVVAVGGGFLVASSSARSLV